MDDKQAYDMAQQYWMIKFLRMYKIRNAMENRGENWLWEDDI